MARRPDLEKFAKQHDLKVGTIADLIRYRAENEKTIERLEETEFSTEFGNFRLYTYRDSVKNDLHFALVKGVIDPNQPIMVRVHIENPVLDLTGGLLKNGRWPIKDVLERISHETSGVVVILCNQIEPDALIEQIRNTAGKNGDVNKKSDRNSKDVRTIGLGSQILSDLGVRKMIVLSSPKRYHALSGFGLEIIDYVSK